MVRGSQPSQQVGGGPETCLVDGHAPGTGIGSDTVEFEDTTTPEPGGILWYLVRGDNSCGAGPYGAASDGSTRTTLACP